jgi:hypothetical protein
MASLVACPPDGCIVAQLFGRRLRGLEDLVQAALDRVGYGLARKLDARGRRLHAVPHAERQVFRAIDHELSGLLQRMQCLPAERHRRADA